MRTFSAPPQACAAAAAAAFYLLRLSPAGADALVLAAGAALFVVVCIARRVRVPSRTRSHGYSDRMRVACILLAAVLLGLTLGAWTSARVRGLEAPPFFGMDTGGGDVSVLLRAEGDARVGSTDEYQIWGMVERICSASGCASAAARGFVRDNRVAGVLAGDIVRLRGTIDRGDDVVFISPLRDPGAVSREISGGWLPGVRRIFVTSFRERTAGWPVGARGVFSALFAGDRSALPRTLERTMRRAGAAHILALSGMHLGILSACIYLLARRLVGVRYARGIVCLFAGGYLVFAGLRPSLVRAVIMLWVASVVRARDRTTTLEVVLSLTFLLHATLIPGDLLSLGFQLSFLSLGGLLYLASPVHELLSPRIPRIVRAGIAAGIAAQTTTAPLVFRTFSEVHPVGVAASVVLTPLAIAIIVLGLVLLFIVPLSFIILPVLEATIAALQAVAALSTKVPSAENAFAVAIFLLLIPCLIAIHVVRYRWCKRRIGRTFTACRSMISPD